MDGPEAEGMSMVGEGRFEEALRAFERALESDCENPDLWNGMGVALRGLGRYAEAAECLERSLRIDPRDRAAS